MTRRRRLMGFNSSLALRVLCSAFTVVCGLQVRPPFANIPASPGVHVGVATTSLPQVKQQPGQRYTWHPQRIDPVGSRACLKDVYMDSLLASKVFVVAEGGIVLRAEVPLGMPGTQNFSTVLNAGAF